MQADYRNGDLESLRDKCVRFQISDVEVPKPLEVLAQLHGPLRGRIVGISDRGVERKAIAVVEVEGLSQPVVLPVSKILHVEE